jgi:hypothetical protein
MCVSLVSQSKVVLWQMYNWGFSVHGNFLSFVLLAWKKWAYFVWVSLT